MGQGVPVEEYERILKADTRHRIKAVLACHNETATGVTSDIAGVRRALDAAKHPALLFVDAVSSLASIDFRMDEWGVDACVSGSQKGFMLPTGLAIVAVSDKALQARKTATLPRTFLSFDDMIATNKDGFFPYTPATTLLRGLRASLDMLFEEGLDNVFARHNRLAEGVREAVKGWGMRLCAADPKWHSDTVSAIMVPDGVNGSEVVRYAYDRYSCRWASVFPKSRASCSASAISAGSTRSWSFRLWPVPRWRCAMPAPKSRRARASGRRRSISALPGTRRIGRPRVGYEHDVALPMKICIYGAGAIGGYLAVGLASVGASSCRSLPVVLISRRCAQRSQARH